MHDLAEIRQSIFGEPGFGVCDTDRSRYVREPSGAS